MELWEVSARESIRETLARYNHAGDSGRVAELTETFTETGQLCMHGRAPVVGRPAILDSLGAVVTRNIAATQPGQPKPMVRHHVSSVVITEVTPHRAKAASYFLVMNRSGPDHWGRYRDELVPVGDRWLIDRREVRVDAQAPTSAFPQAD